MADTVAVTVVGETKTHLVVHMTSISDGTGESAVTKVDKSAYLASDGAEPASLDIEKVTWSCDGMSARLLWDHTTDDLAIIMSGQGSLDFIGAGVNLDTVPPNCRLKDPRSAGDTGDIKLTTTGHTSGDTYNILLTLRKAPD